MRVLHTSDWHLGHRLFGRSRIDEHRDFLHWLADALVAHEVDALLIAGDVFDTVNPPAPALELWYAFLARCAACRPGLSVIVIGGNHDSAARLDAPRQLLRALNVQVVGGARFHGQLRTPDQLILGVPKIGQTAPRLWVAAIPFLRPMDLPKCAEDPARDPLIEGVRAYHEPIWSLLRERRQAEHACIAMGHLYLQDGQLSELSERKVLGGNQHALPVDLFPAWIDYVALGHLHRAQSIGRPCVRYSGSPIPLSMRERNYRHEVTLVDFPNTNAAPSIESLRVPRSVPLLRIPQTGSHPPQDLLSTLERELPQDANAGRAFVELAACLVEPDPELRPRLEAVCEQKGYSLASLVIEYAGEQRGLGDVEPQRDLGELTPQDVLEIMYRERYGDEAPAELLEIFAQLIEDLDRVECTDETMPAGAPSTEDVA